MHCLFFQEGTMSSHWKVRASWYSLFDLCSFSLKHVIRFRTKRIWKSHKSIVSLALYAILCLFVCYCFLSFFLFFVFFCLVFLSSDMFLIIMIIDYLKTMSIFCQNHIIAEKVYHSGLPVQKVTWKNKFVFVSRLCRNITQNMWHTSISHWINVLRGHIWVNFAHIPYCTVTLNSNFAILKTWNCFQLQWKNYLSL